MPEDFPKPKQRTDVIDKFSRRILTPGTCVEFRAFGGHHSFRSNTIEATTYPSAIVGFYNKAGHLASDIRKLNGVSGYVTPNPINENFLHAKNNGFLKATKDNCCTDKDVVVTKYFIIDIDPIRTPKKISATEQERSLAMARRDAILADYPQFLPSCIYGSSGNGAWILVRVSLFNDKDSKKLISQCLGSLATRYGDNTVEIDTNCSNPSRHLPIPGTVKCKGEHTEIRPWRLVTLDGGGLPGWE